MVFEKFPRWMVILVGLFVFGCGAVDQAVYARVCVRRTIAQEYLSCKAAAPSGAVSWRERCDQEADKKCAKNKLGKNCFVDELWE